MAGRYGFRTARCKAKCLLARSDIGSEANRFDAAKLIPPIHRCGLLLRLGGRGLLAESNNRFWHVMTWRRLASPFLPD